MIINDFFNAEFYLARNSDLVGAGLYQPDQLWAHYVQYGAQESAVLSTRSPNNWFDVNQYLALYPDLIQAGITAATALDHFAHYGLYEGREVNALLDRASFSYYAYAEQNPDLCMAFAIDFSGDLTPLQQQQLFGHYLSVGYKEQRAGAALVDGNEWARLVNDKLIIYTSSGQTLGTIGDDEFQVYASGQADLLLDGVGGHDSVLLMTTGAVKTSSHLQFRHIEELVIDGVAIVSATADNALTHITLKATAPPQPSVIDIALPLAISDKTVLYADMYQSLAVLQLTQVEQLYLSVLRDQVNDIHVWMNQVNGNTLQICLDDSLQLPMISPTVGSTTLFINSLASPALAHYEIDARAMTTDFQLQEMGLAVTTRTIHLGAGDTMLSASTAIEQIYLGSGNAVFDFSAAGVAAVQLQQKSIDVIDTITGFTSGDMLQLPHHVSAYSFQTAQLAHGVTLDQLVYLVGPQQVFEWQGDSYVVLAAGASSIDATGTELIKLQGVTLNKLDLANPTATLHYLA